MRGIVSNHEHRIGGLTTWTDIVNSSLPSSFDALKSAAREIGGIQIQNRLQRRMGTICARIGAVAISTLWQPLAPASAAEKRRVLYVERELYSQNFEVSQRLAFPNSTDFGQAQISY